jgi:hypothetical protein
MRLTGPAMSMTASGTMGKVLTFSIWKGIAYGRIRVIPINRNSALQKGVRSILGTLAKACRVVLTLAKDTPLTGTGSQFFIDAVAIAPSGQSWLSYLQQVMNGGFAALVSAYSGMTTVAGYYETQALDAGMSAYTDKSGVLHDAGEQLYILASFAVSYLGYTGFASGITTASSAEVIAFEAYVNESAA